MKTEPRRHAKLIEEPGAFDRARDAMKAILNVPKSGPAESVQEVEAEEEEVSQNASGVISAPGTIPLSFR